MVFSTNEAWWVKHNLNKDNPTPAEVVEFAKTMRGVFWQRAIKWAKSGMKLSKKKDCFIYFKQSDAVCSTCPCNNDCMRAQVVKNGGEVPPPEKKKYVRKRATIANEKLKKFLEWKKSGYYTKTFPKLRILTKKAPYLCFGSANTKEWLTKIDWFENSLNKGSYKEYGGKPLFRLTEEQLLRYCEEHPIKKRGEK